MIRNEALRRWPLVAAALLLPALLWCGLAACGSAGPGAGGTGTEDSDPGAHVAHPSGGNEVVFRVEAPDGFLSPAIRLTEEPGFTLYGDGTVIIGGPVDEIYPPHALPNLQTAKVEEETVQAILSAARAAGLFETGVDYGRPDITDVPSTIITIVTADATYQTSIYALGVRSDIPGLTRRQEQLRAPVMAFVSGLQTLTGFSADQGQSGLEWSDYRYTALEIFSAEATDSGPAATNLQANRLDWPLNDLNALGEPIEIAGYRKALIAGPDLAKLQPLLGQASLITLWTSGGKDYNLYLRPLLPEEPVS